MSVDLLRRVAALEAGRERGPMVVAWRDVGGVAETELDGIHYRQAADESREQFLARVARLALPGVVIWCDEMDAAL